MSFTQGQFELDTLIFCEPTQTSEVSNWSKSDFTFKEKFIIGLCLDKSYMHNTVVINSAQVTVHQIIYIVVS